MHGEPSGRWRSVARGGAPGLRHDLGVTMMFEHGWQTDCGEQKACKKNEPAGHGMSLSFAPNNRDATGWPIRRFPYSEA
jgi:hypothetical protein